MTIYKMKAKNGKLGASFQKKTINYKKLFVNLALALIALVIACMWINWSNRVDEVNSFVFDKCTDSYRSGTISTDYIPYMKDCMK